MSMHNFTVRTERTGPCVHIAGWLSVACPVEQSSLVIEAIDELTERLQTEKLRLQLEVTDARRP